MSDGSYRFGFKVGLAFANVLWAIKPLRPRLARWVLNREKAA